MRRFVTLSVRFSLGCASLVLIWIALYSFQESEPDIRPAARFILIGTILISILLSAVGSKLALIVTKSRPTDALAFAIPFLTPLLIGVFDGDGPIHIALLFWVGIAVAASIVSFGTDYFIRTRHKKKA